MSEIRITRTNTVAVLQCPQIVSGSRTKCRTNGAKKYGSYCKTHFDKLTSEQQVVIQTQVKESKESMKGISNWKEGERAQVMAAATRVLTECKRLTILTKAQAEEITELKKQSLETQANETSELTKTLEEEIAELKKQLIEANQKNELMYEDYNVYQEIRNFEEISGKLMNVYMAESHYELWGLIMDNPKAAIPYLGENPEVQYHYLRNRRNQFCHPVGSPTTGYQKDL